MHRRMWTTITTALLAVLAVTVGLAAPATAAVPPDKPAVLSGWTQTSASSQSSWLAARSNQGAWAAYAFDWSTDYCSDSPDNPLGFDFTLSCARHDFGYRNYKAAGTFSANKSRLDSAFYADLQRRCATYPSDEQAACNSLAWVYYQAVKIFGTVTTSEADLQRAAALLPPGRTAAR